MREADLKGQIVFGFGGLSDMTPCLYEDLGGYWREDDTLRKAKSVEEFSHLRYKDVEQLLSQIEPYGRRYGGGYDGLYMISAEQIEELRAKNQQIAEEEASKERESKQAVQETFDEAKRTGVPVVLDSYLTGCDGSVSDCSTDYVEVYAMPDGTTTKKRTHTF